MIKVFTKTSCDSCKQATRWLESHELSFETIPLKKLEMSDLINILSLTDLGFLELKISIKSSSSHQSRYINRLIDEAESFSEVLELIKSYPQHFKAPLNTDGKKLLVGYNDDEIRKFLPRNFRKQERQSPYKFQ
jgi:regulatory protein spx